MVTVTCLECGKKEDVYPSIAKTKKFCSLGCRNTNYSKRRGEECGFYGKSHTEATKIKVSNKHKLSGNKPPSRKGLEPWNKGEACSQLRGLVRSMETRKKISAAQKGEKGNNWKGGVSEENKRLRMGLDFTLWREEVFKRDNYTCRECGLKGGILHPHHIIPFAKCSSLRFNINNGLTLCKKCHQQRHRKLKLSC